MNWSRVKWFFIICLLAANLILGWQLATRYRDRNVISDDAIADAAALLSRVGIIVAEDAVQGETVRDYVYRIGYHEEAFSSALAAMANSTVTGTYLGTSSGISLIFENGDSASYYPNLYFSYRHGGTVGEDMVRAYEEDPSAWREADGADAEEAARLAKEILSYLTPTSSGSGGVRTEVHIDGIYAMESGYRYLVRCSEMLQRRGSRFSAILSGTSVTVAVVDGTVFYVSGTWLPFLPEETFATTKLDQLGLLFSERERRLASGDDLSVIRHLNAMERAYYMVWDDKGDIYLRPGWLLSYTEGEREFYTLCDGVSGVVLEE